MAQLKGQPLSLSYFFENHISSGVWQTNFIFNQLNGSQPISAQLIRGSAERLLTTHSVMELEISNPCASLRISLQQQFVLVEE